MKLCRTAFKLARTKPMPPPRKGDTNFVCSGMQPGHTLVSVNPADVARGPERKKQNLDNINGLRVLATVWIVLGHFVSTGRDFAGNALFRGMVPVNFYIMLSGFITHYAAFHKDMNQKNAVASYVMKRLARCSPVYYLTVLGGYTVWRASGRTLFDPNAALEPAYQAYPIELKMLLPDLVWLQAWVDYFLITDNPGAW